jgi:hypothetical protein
MKCIQCGTDNKLKERTGNQGRCKNCNHPFAFEPTSRTGHFTDPFFAKTISDISVNHTLYFTKNQFFYFLNLKRIRNIIKFVNPQEILAMFFLYSMFGFVIFTILNDSLFSSTIIAAVLNTLIILALFLQSDSTRSNRQFRQASATALKFVSVFIIVGGLLIGIDRNSALDYFLALAIGGLSLWLGMRQQQQVSQSYDEFLIDFSKLQTYLNTWTRVNGDVAKLLPSPQKQLSPSETQNPSPDPEVTAYSFDRLLVCDSDEIAQMLIANNFHFENNCAVLSITGYPQAIFETTLQMVRRNPNLVVYAFHNASPQGVRLVHQLHTSPTWFSGSNVQIIDLGLLPRQVLATPVGKLFIRRTSESATLAKGLAREIRQNLTEAELAWLDIGNFVELESFTPQKLLQIIQRGIVSSGELDMSDSMSDSGFILLAGGSASTIYAVDSFG